MSLEVRSTSAMVRSMLSPATSAILLRLLARLTTDDDFACSMSLSVLTVLIVLVGNGALPVAAAAAAAAAAAVVMAAAFDAT